VSEYASLRGRAPGNREVSRGGLFAARVRLIDVCGEATPKEGGSWGKHGFPHGSEAKLSDERGVFA
jgi:hypothetical protein